MGDSATASVLNSDDEAVRCADPEFDQFVAYTLSDHEEIWKTVYGCCEQWARSCQLRFAPKQAPAGGGP